MFPESIEITGEGEGVVSMDINGENVLADVSYEDQLLFKMIKKFQLIQETLV